MLQRSTSVVTGLAYYPRAQSTVIYIDADNSPRAAGSSQLTGHRDKNVKKTTVTIIYLLTSLPTALNERVGQLYETVTITFERLPIDPALDDGLIGSFAMLT